MKIDQLPDKIFMDRLYFSQLSKTQKIDFIWNYGEIIHEIESTRYYNSLFLLEDFFVEVKLHKQCNEIVSIHVQENHNILFRYVRKIELGISRLKEPDL